MRLGSPKWCRSAAPGPLLLLSSSQAAVMSLWLGLLLSSSLSMLLHWTGTTCTARGTRCGPQSVNCVLSWSTAATLSVNMCTAIQFAARLVRLGRPIKPFLLVPVCAVWFAAPQAPALVWDDTLAASAANWAGGCPNSHSGYAGVGENMACESAQRTHINQGFMVGTAWQASGP